LKKKLPQNFSPALLALDEEKLEKQFREISLPQHFWHWMKKSSRKKTQNKIRKIKI
jgi:hypothetical protein